MSGPTMRVVVVVGGRVVVVVVGAAVVVGELDFGGLDEGWVVADDLGAVVVVVGGGEVLPFFMKTTVT